MLLLVALCIKSGQYPSVKDDTVSGFGAIIFEWILFFTNNALIAK